MTSTFGGLSIALSSLYAQRRGLELAGHNVSNANTEGYSRQRVDLKSVGGGVPAFFSKWNGDGQGVEVADVTRYRDQFMEIRAALEHGAQANLEQSAAVLDRLEALFQEPSDTGIGAQLSTFWAGFDDVANHPSDTAARTQLLERAGTVATSFNTASNAITQMKADTMTELAATVNEINTTAATIAQLNQSIKSATISDLNANDLMDKRDLLSNKLAALSGGSVRLSEFGQVDVFVNGTGLVSQERSERLFLDTTNPAVAVLRWEKDNFPATITSGTAGGMLQAVNTTLPNYRADLDVVALKLRDDVNAVHSAITGSIPTTAQNQTAAGNLQFDIALNGGGYATVTVVGANWSGAGGAAALQTAMQTAVDAAIGAGKGTVAVTGGNGAAMSVTLTPTAGNALLVKANGANTGLSTLLGTTSVGADGIGGRRFFDGVDASSLSVSADIAGNPLGIAAGTPAGGPLDGSRALDLAELATSTTGSDTLYRSLIVTLGVDGQTTKNRLDIQSQATANLDEARNANAGVNIDEEMVAMVQFQHAYEAAAKYMTMIDSILDTLINRMGVG